MHKKKFFGLVAVVLGAGVLVSSCSDEKPGWEYMPDMYRGPALEAYQPYDLAEDNQSAREPVQGSIPRGFMAYDSYPATPVGYEDAKTNLSMPAEVATDSLAMAEGAKLYGIFCAQCHGAKGAGQGVLVEKGKFLGVPSYADREINAGSIFHVVTYGKGVMGSHASQVTPEERWKIAQHVLKLRSELLGGGSEETTTEEEAASESDTTNTQG